MDKIIKLWRKPNTSTTKTKRIPLKQSLTKEILEDLYLVKGDSLEDIARQFNCTRQIIQIIMEKHGISRRKRSQARVLAIKHGKFERFEYDDIDESFFKSWTPAMAWVLGLIFTDGNFQNTPGRGLRISIHSMDLEMLEKMRALLKSSREIKIKPQSYDKSKHIYRFEFYREEMRKDLASLGLTERKSLTMQFPNVPDQFVRHFIRGCWDGDGSVYLEKERRIEANYVSGSKEFIKKLVHELFKVGISRSRTRFILYDELKQFGLKQNWPKEYPLKIYESHRSKSPTYSIKLNSRDNVKKLFHYFYDGVDETILLKRKYDTFIKGLNISEAIQRQIQEIPCEYTAIPVRHEPKN